MARALIDGVKTAAGFSIYARHSAPGVDSCVAAVLHALLQQLRRVTPLFPLFSNARTGARASRSTRA